MTTFNLFYVQRYSATQSPESRRKPKIKKKGQIQTDLKTDAVSN